MLVKELVFEKKEMSSVYTYFLKPFEFFRTLNNSPKFLIPLILMIVINSAFSIVVSSISYESNQLSTIMEYEFVNENKNILIFITASISIIGQLFTTIGISIFLYFIFSLFFSSIKFRNIFSLMLFAKIPEFMYSCVLIFYIVITKNISFLTDTNSIFMDSIFKIFNPFNLWHFFLLGIVIHVITKMSKTKSFIIVSLFPIMNCLIELLI